MQQNLICKILLACGACALLLAPSAFAANQTVENDEIQWLLCEPSIATFENKLRDSIGDPKTRDVYYMETAQMELSAKSAVIRIRNNDKKIKSSVKINYPDDSYLPWKFLKGKDSKCEWDSHADTKKVGCSLNDTSKRVGDALTDDQKDYLQQEAGFHNFSDLILLGPAQSNEWAWTPKDLNVDLTLEKLDGPQGFVSMELAARVPVADADVTYQQVQQWLEDHHVSLCKVQVGKGTSLLQALLNNRKP